MGAILQSQSQPTTLTPEEDPNSQAVWWCKLLARGVGTIGAGIAVFLGIWTCVSLKPACIAAGILQIAFSLLVLMMESPCCFGWIEATKPILAFAERRPFLQKAIAYGVMALIPLCICFSLSTLFGSGLVLASGVLYGLMALGKKADRGEMMQRAGGEGPTVNHGDDTKINLVNNDGLGGQPQY